MLEKEPDERMTINEILAVPFITEHAEKYLPKDVFAAEFPNYKSNTRVVEEKAVVVKPIKFKPRKKRTKSAVKLPVKAEKGVCDTSAVHGDKNVSFGSGYSNSGFGIKFEFKSNCLKD